MKLRLILNYVPEKFMDENRFWKPYIGWKRLCGDFYSQGISIEKHEFFSDKTINWHGSFHPRSLEICLNYEGISRVGRKKSLTQYPSNSHLAYSTIHCPEIVAERLPGKHRFITFEFSESVLKNLLGDDNIEDFWTDNTLENGALEISLLEYLNWQLFDFANNSKDSIKILSLFSRAYFLLSNLIQQLCHNELLPGNEITKHNDPRIEKTKDYLLLHLDQPLDLTKLSRFAGCSSFHLSRIFSKHEGMTISQYLTKLRMSKAASLLN
ncbi:MAG: AraC family transcriptional regulator, partial [Verrucomicrobiota bacterium]